MASPEIHFLKAEAYAMGYGVTQDMSKAEEEFKTAVSQSVTLYYYYDSIGSGRELPPLRCPCLRRDCRLCQCKMEQCCVCGQVGCHHYAKMAALRFPRQP